MAAISQADLLNKFKASFLEKVDETLISKFDDTTRSLAVKEYLSSLDQNAASAGLGRACGWLRDFPVNPTNIDQVLSDSPHYKIIKLVNETAFRSKIVNASKQQTMAAQRASTERPAEIMSAEAERKK